MIVGAGMFALPYAFLKAGLFWGLAHLAIALFFILVLHRRQAQIPGICQ